ncbi:MAG: DsrE family protein [Armatimonadetes bacterium]|nr:DsrE family protein [Armatimonadota bacterium]
MKRVLFLVRTAPYGSAAIPESVRSCMGFGTMPFQISYLLMDDGAWAVLPGQRPEGIHGNDALQLIQSLADLDVELLVEEHALNERGLSVDGLDPAIRPVSHEEIAELIAQADMVMTY